MLSTWPNFISLLKSYHRAVTPVVGERFDLSRSRKRTYMKPILTMFLVLGFAMGVDSHAQSFPNELDGYRFFGEGKLKHLTFGSTKKADIVKLFGSSCERECEYDERLLVTFDYLSCDDCMTTTHIRDRAM